MSLLDLKTDLKSLKYGQDTPGGGNSGEPYIKVDINKVDSSFNQFRLTTFDDRFVRGGVVGALNSSVVDTLRIGKFLTDFPKGPLFIAKQVGLQLTNPRLESKKLKVNSPTRGQGFINNVGNFISNTANKIENAVGPTRIYNLGINTLAQVPVNAIGGHIFRHGFLPNNDESKLYLSVVTENNFQNNTNRLEGLTNNFNLGPWGANKFGVNKKEQGVLNKLAGLAASGPVGAAIFGATAALFNSNKELEIDNYIAGPDSVYGIGNTIIRRYSDTEDKSKIDFARQQSAILAGRTRNKNGEVQDIAFGLDRLLGASNHTGSIFALPTNDKTPLSNDDDYIPVNLNNIIGSNKDKNQEVAGKSRVDLRIPFISSTADFSISNNTSSSLSSRDFTDLPGLINTNASIGGYSNTGSNSDISSSYDRRNPMSPPIDASNDLVSSGPSTYPDPTIGPIAPLDVTTTVYDYGSPALKTYAAIKNRIDADTTISQKYYGGTFTSKQISIDRNNATYKYNTGAPNEFNRFNDRELNADEIKVIFTPINPFTFGQVPTQFLAYLTSYGEGYNSGWNEIKYTGRAENFYIFNSFKRTVKFGLNIPCYNESELLTNHNKLFALGNRGLGYALAGQYNEKNLLGGVIIKVTVGNYLVDTPGIVNDMSFNIVEGSPWDLDNQYAHYLKVDFSFTVIGDQTPMYEAQPSPEPEPTPTPTPAPPPAPQPQTGSTGGGGGGITTGSRQFDFTPDLQPAPTDYLGKGAGFERANQLYDARRMGTGGTGNGAFQGFDGGNFGGGGASGTFR